MVCVHVLILDCLLFYIHAAMHTFLLSLYFLLISLCMVGSHFFRGVVARYVGVVMYSMPPVSLSPSHAHIPVCVCH